MKLNQKTLQFLGFTLCLALVAVFMPGLKAYGYYYSSNDQYYISPNTTSTVPPSLYSNYFGNYYSTGYNYSPSNYYSNGNYTYYNSPYNTNYYAGENYYNNGYSYNNGYYANGNYSYNDYGALSVSCWANNSYAFPGQPITWTARVSGGYGGNYTFNWSGTDNPQSLNINSINVSYQMPGVKTMNVTVTSWNGQTSTVNCGSSVVNQSYYPIVY